MGGDGVGELNGQPSDILEPPSMADLASLRSAEGIIRSLGASPFFFFFVLIFCNNSSYLASARNVTDQRTRNQYQHYLGMVVLVQGSSGTT